MKIKTKLDNISVKVNDVFISKDEINELFRENIKNMKEENPGIDFTNYQLEMIREEVINKIIDDTLVIEYAKSNNLVPAEDEIQEAYLKLKNSFASPSKFKESMQEMKLSKDKLKLKLKDELCIENVYNHITNFEIDTNLVEEYYNTNKHNFNQGKAVKVKHILVKYDNKSDVAARVIAMDRIREVEDKLKNNVPFEELVNDFSDCPSKYNGGDLGYITKGSLEESIKTIEETAFSLDIGQVSDIIETAVGFHILKVTDVLDNYIPSYQEIKDGLIDILYQIAAEQKYFDFVEDLRNNAKIEYIVEEK